MTKPRQFRDAERRKKIGKRLASIRGKYTQLEFAGRFRVHKNSLARYERGERSPDSEFLAALLEAGYDINWVLAGQGEMSVSESHPSFVADEAVDWDQLEEAMKVIEGIIEYEKRPMQVAQKAQLTRDLYRYYMEHGKEDGLLSDSDRRIVMDIIKSAMRSGVNPGDNKPGGDVR